MMATDMPRRNCVDKLSPAELAIRNAILEVEKVGADVRLTDAVVLLQAAKDSVSDYIDCIETRRFVQVVTSDDGKDQCV
jgi:hypothetical protein